MDKGGVKIGVGMSLEPDTRIAAREAAREAMSRGGLERADWALCFFSSDHMGRADAMHTVVLEETGCLALSGCSATGVIANEREIEGRPALGVMAGSTPGVLVKSALLPESGAGLDTLVSRKGAPHPAQGEDPWTVIALPDSYRVNNDRLVRLLEQNLPGVPVFGAGAADDGSLGLSLQMGLEGVRSASIATLSFQGPFETAVGITQSCTAVGEPHFITAAKDFVMIELDGRPAVHSFIEQAQALELGDMQQAAEELLFGFPLDRESPQFVGESCLVRALGGFDQPTQGLLVPYPMDDRMTMGFMHRSPSNAELDMRRMAGALSERMSGPPDFGLYFDCAARGSRFYGREGVDTSIISTHLGQFPLLGMFGGYELSTAHGAPHVYTYTGVLLLMRLPGEDRESPPR